MKTFCIETYGCRMNICDSEVIISILTGCGLEYSESIDSADVIILNSCSVREDGHNKIYERLGRIEANPSHASRIVVITGCFASLLTEDLFVKYPFVSIIANPNSYRELPSLLKRAEDGERSILVPMEDNDELYEDILPKRCIEDKTTAAINVMKGCNQNCSYCIEPITRGREHCRSVASIINEARDIAENGYRELTLVGHLIDKYCYTDPETGSKCNFAGLLGMVADACPELRIKFLSSHPNFFSDELINVVASHDNIMKVVHLPIQSASDDVLKRMNRGYTREMFAERIRRIRSVIPDMTIITDIMVGFCGETDDDFMQTADFVREMEFGDINVFRFSMRSRTKAASLYADDVPEDEKNRRADIIMDLNNRIKESKYRQLAGERLDVIVEGRSSSGMLYGRDHHHRTVVFEHKDGVSINDTVRVHIESATPRVLLGVSQ